MNERSSLIELREDLYSELLQTANEGLEVSNIQIGSYYYYSRVDGKRSVDEENSFYPVWYRKSVNSSENDEQVNF
jgi:hypothetical protein